jgi:hypothetical protein
MYRVGEAPRPGRDLSVVGARVYVLVSYFMVEVVVSCIYMKLLHYAVGGLVQLSIKDQFCI